MPKLLYEKFEKQFWKYFFTKILTFVKILRLLEKMLNYARYMIYEHVRHIDR